MPRPKSRKPAAPATSGRKPRNGVAADVRITVRFSPAEADALRAGLAPGQALADLIRTRALAPAGRQNAA
jgi:hypothetical protein